MSRPLAVDLCCGLGGWTEGLLAESYSVIGFDIERHQYGEQRYPAQLVIQDILTLDGRQFRGKVSLIVASPPCQFFSYTAMPWSRAKQLAADVRADPVRLAKELALFNACVRIGREAECPIVIENVRGAIPWVGRSAWNYGSFHLWGDVPALMPMVVKRRMKSQISCAPRLFSERTATTPEEAHALHYRLPADDGVKVSTMGAGWYPPGHPKHVRGLGFNTHAERATKNNGGSWFNIGSPGQKVTGQNPVHDGIKQGGDWFGSGENCSISRSASKSSARKAASARIAMIPLPLAQHIARVFKPRAPDMIGSRLMEALELPRGKE